MNENVIISGPGGFLELDADQWFVLSSLGGALPENGVNDWRERAFLTIGGKLPITLSATEAVEFTDALESAAATIPERENIGRVLGESYLTIDGAFTKFAITSKRGWVATDDVEFVFLEEGKELIHAMIALLRRGSVKIEVASQAEGPEPKFRVVK